jgi:protein-S-isoprenylcysteine O-methyltransferase Ste14
MFEGIHEVSVLVAALLAIAIGSIWYSPLLFGKHWMRATNLTEADLEFPKGKLIKLLASAFITNIVLLFVIAQFVALAQSVHEPLRLIGSLITVLLGAAIGSVVIWEQKPFSYFLIHLGYAAVVVFGGMSVIWYWPW